jgi:hypothetical protein
LKCNSTCEEAVQYLYSDKDDGLKLPTPRFILSVIGGSKSFKFTNREIGKSFLDSLIKIARISDTWIITSGIDVGVMKLIGDAIKEEVNTSTFTILGIVNRSRIYGKYPQFKKNIDEIANEKNSHLLNDSNTAFIIVDEENLEDDDFRVKLEAYIIKQLKIPYLMFLVNGGFNSLKTILKSLDYKLPMSTLAVIMFFLILNIAVISSCISGY